MSRRRVEKIAPISATASPTAVDIGQTTSILSDPDGRWVAKRQSTITAALERRHRDQGDRRGDDPDDRALDRNGPRSAKGPEKADLAKDEPPHRLSGESERIGEGDWDESTPFGKHVGYL